MKPATLFLGMFAMGMTPSLQYRVTSLAGLVIALIAIAVAWGSGIL